ncbi:MBL fold metallo-hydrolase [Pectobacterium aroidearum]|uniref:MBL fold metallo-hydrolase n=1 Tax=Pectobacterium aroidearum TaxID=1201031 RepID=UPI0032EE9EF2
MKFTRIPRVLFAGLAVMFALAAGPVRADSPALPPATASLVKSFKDVTIHTLLAPGEMMGNTSHIIELKDQLIIVDGQFYAAYGAQLKAYADKLGKPVTRIYISHSHPDHYFGFGDAFPDVPVYALPGVRQDIAGHGPSDFATWQSRIGSLVPSVLRQPTQDVKPGSETIAGVRFEFERTIDNEAEEALVIKLPDQGVYVAQDLLYNHIHLYVKRPTAGWYKALQKMKADSRYTLFLPGHGEPASRALIDENLAYLKVAEATRKAEATPTGYKAAIKAAYPGYSGDLLIDIYLPTLYPN